MPYKPRNLSPEMFHTPKKSLTETPDDESLNDSTIESPALEEKPQGPSPQKAGRKTKTSLKASQPLEAPPPKSIFGEVKSMLSSTGTKASISYDISPPHESKKHSLNQTFTPSKEPSKEAPSNQIPALIQKMKALEEAIELKQKEFESFKSTLELSHTPPSGTAPDKNLTEKLTQLESIVSTSVDNHAENASAIKNNKAHIDEGLADLAKATASLQLQLDQHLTSTRESLSSLHTELSGKVPSHTMNKIADDINAIIDKLKASADSHN